MGQMRALAMRQSCRRGMQATLRRGTGSAAAAHMGRWACAVQVGRAAYRSVVGAHQHAVAVAQAAPVLGLLAPRLHAARPDKGAQQYIASRAGMHLRSKCPSRPRHAWDTTLPCDGTMMMTRTLMAWQALDNVLACVMPP